MRLDGKLNFYQTDSNTIFSIVFASLFYIMIAKPISYLRHKIRREKLVKKDGLLRLSAESLIPSACKTKMG